MMNNLVSSHNDALVRVAPGQHESAQPFYKEAGGGCIADCPSCPLATDQTMQPSTGLMMTYFSQNVFQLELKSTK